jgi:hypothetical protein
MVYQEDMGRNIFVHFFGVSLTENIERFIEGQAFLRSYDAAPPPASSPVSVPDRRHTGRLRNRCSLLNGKGVGVEPNHTTAKSLALY